MKKKKFYVTTAIDYTNDVVHIGHSYQKILADAFARYHRLIGDKTYFLTGTDEHGQKVEKSAKEKNIKPKRFVDQIATADKAEWDKLNISYDRFIRTTDKDHVKFAQEIYLKSKKAGDIYPGIYDGLYCEGCEAYLTESDLKGDHCPFHPKKKILKIKEKNYFFRLSKYQKFLENLLEKNPKFVVPESKRKEALSFVKSGLKDFAVSRPNIKWGIPAPDDTSQTIYVWFDALINYLTYGEQNDCWPASIHILGKDNLRFHAIYWPAMLKSTGYELPKTILIHDFISLNGQRISKSLGNIIQPSKLTKQYGSDPVRYYFLRYGPLRSDTDFTIRKFEKTYNADLANGLGNLTARVAKLCEKSDFNFKKQNRQEVYPQAKKFFDEFRPDEALTFIWQEKISGADKFIDKEKPWQLKGKNLETVLQKLVSEIRQIAFNIRPFLPETAEKIEKQFAGPKIKAEKPLFPRLEKTTQTPKGPQRTKLTISDQAQELGLRAKSFYFEGISQKRADYQEIRKFVDQESKKILKNWSEEKFKKDPVLNEFRKIRQKLGKKHIKNLPPSSEGLVRYLLDYEKLPKINPIVDLYNLVSLETLTSIGVHDPKRLVGNVVLGITKGNEKFIPLASNQPQKVPAGIYAYLDSDQKRVICLLESKQSEETKVRKRTKNLLAIIEGNSKADVKTIALAEKKLKEYWHKFLK